MPLFLILLTVCIPIFKIIFSLNRIAFWCGVMIVVRCFWAWIFYLSEDEPNIEREKSKFNYWIHTMEKKYAKIHNIISFRYVFFCIFFFKFIFLLLEQFILYGCFSSARLWLHPFKHYKYTWKLCGACALLPSVLLVCAFSLFCFCLCLRVFVFYAFNLFLLFFTYFIFLSIKRGSI